MNICVITPQETYQQLADAVQQGIVAAFSALFDEVTPCGQDYQNGGGSDSVVGLMSFIGTVSWSLAISFPAATATAMAQKFVGCEIPFESADMIDLAGELLNIAAGPISAQLVAKGFDAKMGLPSVARGHNVEVVLPDHMAYRLHFASGQGDFRVKIVAAQSA